MSSGQANLAKHPGPYYSCKGRYMRQDRVATGVCVSIELMRSTAHGRSRSAPKEQAKRPDAIASVRNMQEHKHEASCNGWPVAADARGKSQYPGACAWHGHRPWEHTGHAQQASEAPKALVMGMPAAKAEARGELEQPRARHGKDVTSHDHSRACTAGPRNCTP